MSGEKKVQRFSARLMLQMPVIVAFGVNLGIVPLLFLQAAYGKVFYPATILIAWPWLAIVFLVIPARRWVPPPISEPRRFGRVG